MTRWLQAAKQATAPRTKLTEPTKPHRKPVLSVLSEGELSEAAPPAETCEADALDRYEERAAIREHDGGQTRAEAEAAALGEAARVSGTTPGALKRAWADHPDARAYLAFLRSTDPNNIGAAASALGWGATRAWQAEARLRAAGLVRLGPLGEAEPSEGRDDRRT